MGMVDWIVIALLGVIIGAAVTYIIRAKMKGKKCIGCPDSSACAGHCESCHGCRHRMPKE